jgi:hypothetical protein
MGTVVFSPGLFHGGVCIVYTVYKVYGHGGVCIVYADYQMYGHGVVCIVCADYQVYRHGVVCMLKTVMFDLHLHSLSITIHILTTGKNHINYNSWR